MKSAHFIGIALVVLSSLAFLAGGVWAGCDVAMRPFAPAFALEFGLLSLFNPIVAVSVVALSALAAIGLQALRRRVNPTRWPYIVVALFATIPVTAIATAGIASMLGVHPQPGNCVI